jgi:hypothetical protein
MSKIDDMLERQRFADMLERCTDKGVKERPPVAGVTYAAFAVHPPYPGNLLGVAIAHRAGDKFVVDLVRGDISVDDACAVLKRYGIAEVIGAVGEEDCALAHAVCGVLSELRLQ